MANCRIFCTNKSPRIACALLWLAFSGSLRPADLCNNAVFLGFDSRLSVRPAGRLPAGNDTVLAFELFAGKPTIAFDRELIFLDNRQALHLPTPFRVTGLLADGLPTPVATAADGIYQFGPSGWEPSHRFPAALAGSLHNSGAVLPLATISDTRATGFLAFRSVDSSYPIARVEGPLHALSWNTGGLAAIVGSSLVTWKAGGNELRTLRTDPELAEARDVCFLSANRALVSTKRRVYLVTADGALVVFGMPGLCRSYGGSLYVLDTVNRMIWLVGGSDRIGGALDDRQHALELLAKSGESSSEKDPPFLEAARILGCEEARRQKSIQPQRGSKK
jgi:hypothetical protein